MERADPYNLEVMPNYENFIPPPESQHDWFRVEEIDASVGLGVVACRRILPGTPLNFFSKRFGLNIVMAAEAKEFHKSHGIARWDLRTGLHFVVPDASSPETLRTGEPGWFLNHQPEAPNVLWDPLIADGLCVATGMDEGDELRIDYAYLREPPEHARRDESAWYYRGELPPVPQYDPSILLAPAEWTSYALAS
jgi:hypothetical protein